jgi:hypothetical protein
MFIMRPILVCCLSPQMSVQLLTRSTILYCLTGLPAVLFSFDQFYIGLTVNCLIDPLPFLSTTYHLRPSLVIIAFIRVRFLDLFTLLSTSALYLIKLLLTTSSKISMLMTQLHIPLSTSSYYFSPPSPVSLPCRLVLAECSGLKSLQNGSFSLRYASTTCLV